MYIIIQVLILPYGPIVKFNFGLNPLQFVIRIESSNIRLD